MSNDISQYLCLRKWGFNVAGIFPGASIKRYDKKTEFRNCMVHFYKLSDTGKKYCLNSKNWKLIPEIKNLWDELEKVNNSYEIKNTLPCNMGKYLFPNTSIDCDNKFITSAVNHLVKSDDSNRRKAVEFFYFVRDTIKYIPHVYSTPGEYKASKTLLRGEGNCVSKAVLLCALGRAARIPSRLGFVNLVCHQKENKLRKLVGNVFYYHGYCEFWLNNQWIITTPAFDLETVKKHNVIPVRFDGGSDAKFSTHDLKGNKFMEYDCYHGSFANIPTDMIPAIWFKKYGQNIDKIFADKFPSRV